MPYQELSDDDLTAIVSFLRSQKPVEHYVEPTEYSFIGKAIMAFGLLKPEGPKNKPSKSIEIDSTIKYGAYLANSVGNCFGCHTKRDLKTGMLVGTAFAGGGIFPADEFSKGYSFFSPNLTPHKETGVMTEWDFNTFKERFRSGRTQEGTPMPWGAFSRMDDLELKALYRYLQSLDPVENKIDKAVYAPGEMFVMQ